MANKVHFTNSVKDMEAFIAAAQIPKSLDGQEDWTYAYVEPTEGENARMLDTATRDALLAEREAIVKQYEDATREWIANPGAYAASLKAKRDAIAARLREDYWKLDPYVRARSWYDRIGVLKEGGAIDYYPEKAAAADKKQKEVDEVASNLAAVAITEKQPELQAPQQPGQQQQQQQVQAATNADDVD